jgi:hypothetical protein
MVVVAAAQTDMALTQLREQEYLDKVLVVVLPLKVMILLVLVLVEGAAALVRLEVMLLAL